MALARAVDQEDACPKALLMNNTAASYPAFADLGPAANDVLYMSYWEPSLPVATASEFAAQYEEEYGSLPANNAAQAYAALEVLATSIENTGTLDQAENREYVSDATFETVIGTLSFGENGLPEQNSMLLVQWQDGEQVIVWPSEKANGDARWPRCQ
jgi:branched-chain amino acid transport system substrate-binding protein